MELKNDLSFYKWKLSDIFESDKAWEDALESAKSRLEDMDKYHGKLEDIESLKACLKLNSELSKEISRLYQYAKLAHDVDTRVALYQGMTSKAEMLIVSFDSATSYIVPELAQLSVKRLEELANDKELENYSVFFKEILRNKAIILSKEEEKILSEVGIFADTNEDVFGMFDNADIKFPHVTDEHGNRVQLSHGVYGMLLQSPSQKVRARAFAGMFSIYRDHVNMLAANYAGNVKKDWFFAKTKKFSSSLEYAMYRENVPTECYEKLLAAVDKGLEPLHRYVALRKRVLPVKTLNMYDLYVPIVEEQDLKLSYDDAVDLVKDALKVMGKEYGDVLASAFESNWVDVFEGKGKKSGAYAWGVYGVHPYVLLNYQPSIHEVFTIAHELGHAMHSYFSNLNQPYEKADYEIFTAEIASTVNEVLLLKHLLKSADGEMKKYLLSYYLDMFRTTFFRQTMFGEFEELAHKKVEDGEPLSADVLCDMYYALNKKYYGKAVKHNDLIKYEWARIPHFFNSFYVYKYATGITTAVSIASNILEQGESYFEKYKKFLSAGGSLPPLDVIKLADVDLLSDKPFEKALGEFEGALEELEALLK